MGILGVAQLPECGVSMGECGWRGFTGYECLRDSLWGEAVARCVGFVSCEAGLRPTELGDRPTVAS